MTYSDLTVLKFQQIQNAIKISEGNEIREAYNVLSVLTDTPVQVYRDMKYADFQKECKKLAWLSECELPDKWVKDFVCCDEKFTIVQFATDWTTDQFINMSNLTKDSNEIINNLHLILATLTKGGTDNLTEFDRRSKLFQEHLTIDVAYPTGFFFAAFLAKLSTTTQYSSLMKKKLREAKKMTSGLKKNTTGMQ